MSPDSKDLSFWSHCTSKAVYEAWTRTRTRRAKQAGSVFWGTGQALRKTSVEAFFLYGMHLGLGFMGNCCSVLGLQECKREWKLLCYPEGSTVKGAGGWIAECCPEPLNPKCGLQFHFPLSHCNPNITLILP